MMLLPLIARRQESRASTNVAHGVANNKDKRRASDHGRAVAARPDKAEASTLNRAEVRVHESIADFH